MPEDENGLRVGGWVPPYSAASPADHPAYRPALPRVPDRRVLRPGPTTPPPSSPRHLLLLTAAAALGCAVTATVALNSGEPDPAERRSAAAHAELPRSELPQSELPSFPIMPELTVPSQEAMTPQGAMPQGAMPQDAMPPQGAVRPVGTTSPRPSSPTPAVPRPPLAATATTAPPPPTPSQVAGRPPVTLTVGATTGLELADRPGQRVRHRRFAGRVDAIGADSSEVERADSRFVVRAGRAESTCFSLESVNFPGYYLRHRDYEIHLERADRSELFDEDSTFCAEPISGGAAVSLRSHNYPGFRVALRDARLVIAPDGAATFVPRPPL